LMPGPNSGVDPPAVAIARQDDQSWNIPVSKVIEAIRSRRYFAVTAPGQRAMQQAEAFAKRVTRIEEPAWRN
jgi:hypothetical protein